MPAEYFSAVVVWMKIQVSFHVYNIVLNSVEEDLNEKFGNDVVWIFKDGTIKLPTNKRNDEKSGATKRITGLGCLNDLHDIKIDRGWKVLVIFSFHPPAFVLVMTASPCCKLFHSYDICYKSSS